MTVTTPVNVQRQLIGRKVRKAESYSMRQELPMHILLPSRLQSEAASPKVNASDLGLLVCLVALCVSAAKLVQIGKIPKCPYCMTANSHTAP